MHDIDLRQAALQLASNTHEPAEMVVERAEQYFAFLQKAFKSETIKAGKAANVKAYSGQDITVY